MIDLHRPNINKNSYKYIKKCLSEKYISTSGNFVNLFENSVKKITNSKYAIAVNSGSSALYLSLKLSKGKPGDEVIVPTLSFISPINAIIQNLLSPIFMDVDNYFNIDENKTINFIQRNTFFKNGITYNKNTKKRISVIVIVHTFGNPVKFDKLFDLCKKRNIDIIEDAAESLGSKYSSGKFKFKHTGTIGKFGCLSFNANKIVTTGAGGMILTQNSKLAKRAYYLSTTAKDDPINFIHNESGYNLRLNNICAALGISQTEKFSKTQLIKKKIFKEYKKYLCEIPNVKIFQPPKYAESNYWLILLKVNNFSINSLVRIFNEKNIQVRPIWRLNHLQKPFNKYERFELDNCHKMKNKHICLPASSDLKLNEIKRICKILKAIL